MTWPAQAKAWVAGTPQRARAWAYGLRDQPLVPAIALAWFALALTTILWVWGLNPEALASPDEALNHLAADVLSRHGSPVMSLPFADPEDLAHPRHWVSVGARALPTYAPVAIYGYALLLRLGKLGLLLIAAFPAAAAAAFAAGTAKLLPSGRKWLALPAPVLGFPAMFWLLRPWMNLSVLLICICWAFYFWAAWRRSACPWHLGLAIAGVGAAAAVRPDYAAYAFLVALLLAVAQSRAEWKRIALFIGLAGLVAVASNLLLNWRITGHPTLAAYQMVASPAEGGGQSGGLLGLLRQLLMPMGVPDRGMVLEFLSKYWLQMGPIAGVTLGLLSLVPLLLKVSRWERALHVAAVLVLLCFVLSHMDRQLNGASESLGLIHHSMPRYWSPVYLLAGLPPILFLGQVRQRAVLAMGAALVCALAVAGGYEVHAREKFSLVSLRDFERRSLRALRGVRRNIPETAMVYSAMYDKILWSRWRVGSIDQPEPTAASMNRAKQAGLDVFVYEPKLKRPQYLRLERALRKRQLQLTKGAEQGIYRVVQAE